MQLSQPQTISQKILCQLLPQFASKADQWSTVERIKADAKTVINLLADLTGLKLIAVDQQPEPQSEDEGNAPCDFTQSILTMIEQFLDARKKSTISHETDLADLKRTREDMLQTIQRFQRFQSNCEDSLLGAVKSFAVQIDILESQLIENHKLTDHVLADVKEVFAAAIVKLQTLPERKAPAQVPVPAPKLVNIPPKPVTQVQKLREFKIPTTYAAKGRPYAFPANPEFNNPIAAIHQNYATPHCHLKFETNDGVVGEHPPSNVAFARLALPALCSVNKIRVYTHGNSFVEAIEFFDKDGVSKLKSTGRKFDTYQDVVLEEGERLLAIRSTLYGDQLANSTAHCNMTLVIGRIE